MRAIAIYESLFSDPITIQILFRYSTGGPAPSPSPTASPSASPSPSVCPSATPFPPGVLSQSFFVPYDYTVEQFHQRVESRRNNQQRQYSERQSARERVIYKHRAIQCERASAGIEHTAGPALRRHHRTGRTV